MGSGVEVPLGIDDGIKGNLTRDRGPSREGFITGFNLVLLPFRIASELFKGGFFFGNSGEIRIRGLRSELLRAEKVDLTILNLQVSPCVGVIVVEGEGKSRIIPKNGPGHGREQKAFRNRGIRPFLEDRVTSQSTGLPEESLMHMESFPSGEGVKICLLNEGGKEILEFLGLGYRFGDRSVAWGQGGARVDRYSTNVHICFVVLVIFYKYFIIFSGLTPSPPS
jgi:hypothetical protein